MDSLTQAALGAAVGGAVLGPRLGWRGFAWGAALGTLPDLDSLVPMGGPVADFTYHRGYSHALAVVSVAAPLLAWPLQRLHRHRGAGLRRWLAAVWLVLVTHVLLDACTIYGTQLLLPFSDYPVGLGAIFIIDPAYTLPLVAGVVAALALGRRHPGRARRCNAAGLALATAYLAWTDRGAAVGGAARADAAIERAGLPVERVLATPTAFNSLLWRIVAVGRDAHWEGFHALGTGREVRLTRYPRAPALLDGIRERWAVTRLQAFTKGFYTVEERAGAVVITDLRMGQAGYYAFAFVVGERRDGRTAAVPVRRFEHGRPPLDVVVRELAACARGEATRVLTC
ncbi:MAG: metal-dependent hydrolase [Halofilum sp. (in: g-proteobacteria)]|nr:metal-dependent hydrolase [Halofilum sp. (in: g-proteobacteria)]